MAAAKEKLTLQSGHEGKRLPEWINPNTGRTYYLSMHANGEYSLKNPFVISRTIEKTIGGQIEGAFTQNNGKLYVLKVQNKDHAKSILKLERLLDGTQVKVSLHQTLNTRKFIVSCSEAIAMTEKELLEELRPQKIIAVRRLQKNSPQGKMNTATLVLTINSTIIPEFISFGFIRVRTKTYYPLPVLCYNCFQYGHIQSKCANLRVCRNCSVSQDSHDSDTCSTTPFCLNCREKHQPNNRNCSVWRKEVEIIKTKTDQGISLAAARKAVTERLGQTSYASVLRGERNTVNRPNSNNIEPTQQQQCTRTQINNPVVKRKWELTTENRQINEGTNTSSSSKKEKSNVTSYECRESDTDHINIDTDSDESMDSSVKKVCNAYEKQQILQHKVKDKNRII